MKKIMSASGTNYRRGSIYWLEPTDATQSPWSVKDTRAIREKEDAGEGQKETLDASWKGEPRSFDAIVGRQIGCTRGKWDWFLSESPGAPPAGGMP